VNPVFEFGNRIGEYSIFLDIDLDPNTGRGIYSPGELGIEYGIVFTPIEGHALDTVAAAR
jgi:hypothetical protein